MFRRHLELDVFPRIFADSSDFRSIFRNSLRLTFLGSLEKAFLDQLTKALKVNISRSFEISIKQNLDSKQVLTLQSSPAA